MDITNPVTPDPNLEQECSPKTPMYPIVLKVLGWIALAGMSSVLFGKFGGLVSTPSSINVVLGYAGLAILGGFWIPVVVSWVLSAVKLLNSQEN